jgi:hypothetical protein
MTRRMFERGTSKMRMKGAYFSRQGGTIIHFEEREPDSGRIKMMPSCDCICYT